MTRIQFSALAATLAATMMSAGCARQPASSAPLSSDSTISDNVADVDVTQHVLTALNQSQGLKNTKINVVTRKGDVRLTGVLDSQAQIVEAVRVARTAEGVHAIHDELSIRK